MEVATGEASHPRQRITEDILVRSERAKVDLMLGQQEVALRDGGKRCGVDLEAHFSPHRREHALRIEVIGSAFSISAPTGSAPANVANGTSPCVAFDSVCAPLKLGTC